MQQPVDTNIISSLNCGVITYSFQGLSSHSSVCVCVCVASWMSQHKAITYYMVTMLKHLASAGSKYMIWSGSSKPILVTRHSQAEIVDKHKLSHGAQHAVRIEPTI